MTNTYTRWLGTLAAGAVLLSFHTTASSQSVHELQLTASKYQFEPSTIQVTAGEPVRLIIRSKDRVHGFSMPTLKIDARIPKDGDAVTIEFVAPPPGEYEIACSEFCGIGHRHMKAALISVAPTPH